MLVLLVAVVSGAWAQDPTYIVAGNNSDIFGIPWYGTYEANKMTKGGDGKYTKTYNVEDAISDIQLKVVKDGEDWIGDKTGENVTFSMKQAGSFTVTLDPNANPVCVTVTGDNVVFANTEYAINYATGMQNGTVTGPNTAKKDDEVTLTITPAAGYVLESISVTGVTTENAVEVTDGKFTMPAEDVNVIATFKLVTYSITLAEGTEDAGNWNVPAEAAEGSPVTVTYKGDKKVKSVKAVKKADNAYLKWDADQKKLVATEIPAEVTKVENSNENVTWAGTYVVEGDVTISGEIKLTGDVELIIKDGATLTVTKIIHTQSGASLSVYGQTQMSGELNVTNQGSDAIFALYSLAVHSCKVKATSPAGDGGGVYNTTTLNVYGGSLDAEYTGEGSGHGIILKKGGALNIYGGEVKAVGKGNHADYSYGIKSSSTKDVANIKVYGGKLWAECADNKAFRQINLTTEAGFNGKIETSGNGDEWTPWESGTPETKYVRVGY